MKKPAPTLLPLPERDTPIPPSPPPSTNDTAPVIATENLTYTFSKDAGVEGLTFNVMPGTIFGLIGPSGSGKTTTVRLLTGLYHPQAGQVTVLGGAPSEFGGAMRERLGYMPQQFVLYPQLSVWENLNFVASVYGMPPWGRGKHLQELLDFVELTDARSRLASQLSGGMQRRLALAAALVNDPVLLFLDEPTAGLDPVLRQKIWEYFEQLRGNGRTLVVTTQYVGEAAYCDYIGVMRAGKLVYIDTPGNLRRTALGGEVIKLVVDAPHEREATIKLDALPIVNHVHRSLREPGHLLVYTDDAATTLPQIVTHLNGGSGITVQQIDKYEPPFDDVFVRLMEESAQDG